MRNVKRWTAAALCCAFLIGQMSCLSGCRTALDDDTRLYRAIMLDDLEWVKETVAKEKDIDHIRADEVFSFYKTSALSVAMDAEMNSGWDVPTQVFRYLLEAGADVNITLSSGGTLCTEVAKRDDFHAIHYFKLLIQYGADINKQNRQGYTPLDVAVLGGQYKAAEYLLEQGAIPTETTIECFLKEPYNQTGHGENAYRLLQTALKDFGVTTTLIPECMQRAFRGEPVDLQTITEEGCYDWYLFCLAALGGAAELDAAVSVEAGFSQPRNSDGESLLAAAAKSGNMETLEFLLGKVTDPELRCDALLAAVEHEQPQCALRILQNLSDKDLKDNYSDSSKQLSNLYEAASVRDNIALLEALMARGVCPDEALAFKCCDKAIRNGAIENLRFFDKNYSRLSAWWSLRKACRYQNMEAMEFIIASGDWDQSDIDDVLTDAAYWGFQEGVQYLLELGADPHYTNEGHGSALVAATIHGYDTIAEMLLAAGASPNQAVFPEMKTPLMYARSNRLLRRLIDAGADVNYQDTRGYTPLMNAARNNRTESIITLLENGADISMKNNEGKTALDIANEEHSTDAAALLRRKGG